MNCPEHGQADLKCYCSLSSFSKAMEASVSLVHPVLFMQEHQMSEDWSNTFLNGMRLRQITESFKWKRPLRSLLFLFTSAAWLPTDSVFSLSCEWLGWVLDNCVIKFFRAQLVFIFVGYSYIGQNFKNRGEFCCESYLFAQV